MKELRHVPYMRGGREVTREEFDRTAKEPKRSAKRKAAVPMATQAYSDSKPLVSNSMGCHPEQVDMLNAAAKEHGIRGVEWDRKGNCRITSRRGRAKAMKVFGNMVSVNNVHDGDGGYSDG